jgi:hypothetical protein
VPFQDYHGLIRPEAQKPEFYRASRVREEPP